MGIPTVFGPAVQLSGVGDSDIFWSRVSVSRRSFGYQMASAFWYQKMAEQYYLYNELTDLCVKDSDIFWYQNYAAKVERGPQNIGPRDQKNVGIPNAV